METNEKTYTQYFCEQQNAWWKKLLPVQVPYRYNIRRLCKGKVLDVGCGTGRHLDSVPSHGIGIDHNLSFVSIVKEKGITAFLPYEFVKSKYNQPEYFDTLLLSHVIEHLLFDDVVSLIKKYLINLKHCGRVVIIVPQILGYKSDPTHKTYFDEFLVEKIADILSLKVMQINSFPFPRVFGTIFVHNELVLVLKK